ncbi:DNA methyltransferase [Ancylobacter sp.]|uniref:DNA methyltransferase n=1 Tax=Ancylobacter sp. TaxID=1872567 RepID=UPI003C7C036C
MEPETFLDGRVTLFCGDSRQALDHIPAGSIDACVCDPPYALVSIGKRFGKAGAAPASGNDAYARASAGFMGQSWDTGEVAFSAAFWRKVFRVLKPGGHVVAFGGTRAYHRLAVAIEDAGFEIRDSIAEAMSLDPMVRAFVASLDEAQLDAFMRLADLIGFEGLLAWVYGTGFPKSHDVSKALDKRKNWNALPKLQGAIRTARAALGISQNEAARRMGLIGDGETLGGGGFMWFETGMRAPTREQWPQLKAALSLGDEFDECFEEVEREVTGTHVEWTGRTNYAVTSKDGLRRDKPASDAAREWQGWGTALKPAWEPIVLARKPLVGTVAENVLAHGTGALNIDGCRVDFAGAADEAESKGKNQHDDFGSAPRQNVVYGRDERAQANYNPPGRHPANVIQYGSREVTAAFPSDGEQSAARFFYSAKADSDDRLGSKHPTVKPVDLMQWLVRLVTAPGGTVLDPFAGTGTTGEAAWREGFRAVLIEREPQFQADIRRRMDLAAAGPGTRRRAAQTERAKTANAPALDGLFSNLTGPAE